GAMMMGTAGAGGAGGAGGTISAKPVPDTVSEVIASGLLPRLQIWNVRITVWPGQTTPKSMLPGRGPSCSPVPAITRTVYGAGSAAAPGDGGTGGSMPLPRRKSVQFGNTKFR